jgi:hypothetical protein
MNVTRSIQIITIVVAGIALVGNQVRIDGYYADGPLHRLADKNVSPTVALTTFALGPMRALIVDALWWRAMEQQDNGEYFDALQLANWITQLQPDFASVWQYQGWNMAYNISYDFADPLERWAWIERALALMRDEGLKFNPESQVIRKELATLFYSRIGGNADPHGIVFKNQWAFKMMEYLDRGTAEELRQLLETSPDDPLYERRERLEADLKLDIEHMLFIDENYGPFDWRLHQAHAVYWVATEKFDDYVSQGVNYKHIIRQSMMDSFTEGRLFYDKQRNTITRTNNLEIIGRIHDYIEFLMANEYTQAIDTMHKDFLEQAIAVLYSYNLNEQAYETFVHYKADYMSDDSVAYEAFVAMALEKTLKADQSKGRQAVVEAALYESLRWIDIGEYDRANGSYNLARLLWQRHQSKFIEMPARQLPPFEQLLRSVGDMYAREHQMDSSNLANRLADARQQRAKAVYLGPTDAHEGR